MIPYARQDITETDIEAVVEILKSDFLTQGPVVPAFEQAVATKCGAKYAVAVNSATSALHIACLALNLGKGDRLWTVPNTFVASANCGHYCGAEVDFVDIDPLTWNLSISCLKEKLAEAKARNQLPKVLVPVHFAGQPTEQEAIWELAQEFGFKVIEDASHAIGASRNGESVGSCRWSDITVFSFHPVKIITSGEGGMALTNKPEVAERMALLRSHGITRDRNKLLQSAQGAWYYEQQALGFNYRMTDIHAALGLSQLDRLEAYIARRNTLAKRYDSALKDSPIQLPTVLPENHSAFHLYVIRIRNASHTGYRDKIFDKLRMRDIGVSVHYPPVHLQPYYRQFGFLPGQYTEAETHAREAISLPLYPTMSEQQQDDVVMILNSVI